MRLRRAASLGWRRRRRLSTRPEAVPQRVGLRPCRPGLRELLGKLAPMTDVSALDGAENTFETPGFDWVAWLRCELVLEPKVSLKICSLQRNEGSVALRFDVCSLCDERHVVTAGGAMSIHQTEAGERCPGAIAGMFPARPWPKPRPPKVELPHEAKAKSGSLNPEQSRERREAKQALLREKKNEQYAELAPEMRDAFETATFSRGRGNPMEPQKKATPIVYVTKTTRVVSGGLPTLGRGR